jgi:alpha,alpha-trehalase
MVGSIDIMQRGYTGIETRGGVLRFNPALPERLDRLSMRLRYRRHALILHLRKDHLRLRSVRPEARPITVHVGDQVFTLPGGEMLECSF